ncbi:MAG: error-prone DNA polymerase [Planctomycetes bacterium]|nr:error-prone DNA polymerase [Planctomycetota bacterium]
MSRQDRYAELQCKTNFSFLCGASHAEELVARAVELGHHALAITDVNTLAGVVRAHAAAKPAGLKLLIGAEIQLFPSPLRGEGLGVRGDASPPGVLLYAPDITAYRRLSTLITRGRRAAKKGECHLTFEDVAEHADGLIAAILSPSPPACRNTNDSAHVLAGGEGRGEWGTRQHSGQPPSPPTPLPPPIESLTLPCHSGRRERGADLSHSKITHDHLDDELRVLAAYRDIFKDRCYLAVSLHHGSRDAELLERSITLSRQARLPLLATNDVHYHHPERRPLHDVLTGVRHGATVAELGMLRFANAERHLKSAVEMAELFARCPQALAHGIDIADRCTFSLDELRYEYPEELCPPGTTPSRHLAELTWNAAKLRYPGGIPDKVVALLRHELNLIEELRYEAFFLTVWDLVKFARSRGILCQGRGSAANSAVCYCLGITSVDPDRTDLLFERFVSRERNEAPDIDVDFEHERREEVLQYIYQKYGRDRAGIVAEVICYRPRSAVRDVGKALGLSLDGVDRLAKVLDQWSDAEDIPARIREAGFDPRSQGVVQLVQLATALIGFPRHLSQHVGGFVITCGPLSELVPIENAAMPERTVIEWDKDDLDTLGILKVDCLALGMLTCIRKSFDLIDRHHGTRLELATVPAEDPAVYEMICRADTVGVFQIESRAQMSMLPRLLPRCFYDLVIEVAIVRPGPIQGGMVHPFLRRRNGEEPVTYPSAEVEEVLAKTLGVPLFQEQVMRLAMVAAGFTPGEADQLRRAMGAWKRLGIIDKFRSKLRDGMLARGLPVAFADQLFEQVRGFGSYGFPESHAASFALLAYVSAWLKHHYPAAFACALLNSQPMGFYAPAQIVRDANEHGVTVHPADVNESDWDCTLEFEPEALRLGLRLIRGMPNAQALAIIEARQRGWFRSLIDLKRRASVGRPLLARLAAADAFGSLGLNRRTALWQVLELGEELPLFAELDEDNEPTPFFAEMPMDRQVRADYETTGLSLKAHPIGLLREELSKLNVTPASALTNMPDKASVTVAGMVLVRQQPSTSKGTIFMTLEDDTGAINLVIWPHVWKRFRPLVRSAVAVLAQGKIERVSRVIHIMPQKMEDLSKSLRGLMTKSRDFH